MEPMHPCKALVLYCIDFRFRKTLIEFLDSKFGDSYDLVSIVGGVKELVSGPQDHNFILGQFRISDRLHKPEVIVLIQHEDCGAYGGSKKFRDTEQEIDFQRQELKKAKALLAKHFPDKSVEAYVIRLSRGVDSMVRLE